MQIEKENLSDITGYLQHGCMQNRGSCTAGLVLQSIIVHALMANLDLSAAFDIVAETRADADAF